MLCNRIINAGRDSLTKHDFACFACPGMLPAIFYSKLAGFAGPVTFSVSGTKKTLTGPAKPAKFVQKIAKILTGQAKPANFRFP